MIFDSLYSSETVGEYWKKNKFLQNISAYKKVNRNVEKVCDSP